jgi:hypothetical protein
MHEEKFVDPAGIGWVDHIAIIYTKARILFSAGKVTE